MFLCSLMCLLIRSKSTLEDSSTQVGINHKDHATSNVLSPNKNICSKSPSTYEEKENKKDNCIQVRHTSLQNGMRDHSSEETVFQENSIDDTTNLTHLTDRNINNNILTGEKDVSECQNSEHENFENVNSNLMHVKNFESMNQSEIEKNDNSIADRDIENKIFYIRFSTFLKELPESTQNNEKEEESKSNNANNKTNEKRNWLLDFANHMLFCYLIRNICYEICARLRNRKIEVEIEFKPIVPKHVICIEKPKNFLKAEEFVRKLKDEDTVYMFKQDF